MMNRRLPITLYSLAAITAAGIALTDADALADSNYCVRVEIPTTAYSCNPLDARCNLQGEEEWTFEIPDGSREYGRVDDDHPVYCKLSDFEDNRVVYFWVRKSTLSPDFECKDNHRR